MFGRNAATDRNVIQILSSEAKNFVDLVDLTGDLSDFTPIDLFVLNIISENKWSSTLDIFSKVEFVLSIFSIKT